MSGRIPEWFIDQVRDRTDLLQLIGEYVTFKKSGADSYKACCPFHQEKTPSFYVTPSKQLYYCFGCGAKGNALTFTQEYLHLSFVESIDFLAKRLGMEIPQEPQTPAQTQAQQILTQGNQLLEIVAKFYRSQLKQHPQSIQAITYLKNRGISSEIAQKFQIGFAPQGNLLSHWLKSQDNQLIPLALEAGLVTSQEQNQLYDRFRQRILFPIRQRRGQVVGFGGRALGDIQPKYLNSSDSRWFNKSEILYGLYEATQARADFSYVILVEGYMDVIALHQAGLTQALATLGTASNTEHFVQIFKLTPQVILCFDGDKAGQQAALKALKIALPLLTPQRQIKIALLPSGEDPDSLVKKAGAEAFHNLINQAPPASRFVYQILEEKYPGIGAEESAQKFSELAQWFQLLTDPLLKDGWILELASLWDMHVFALAKTLHHRYSGMVPAKKNPNQAWQPFEKKGPGLKGELVKKQPPLLRTLLEILNRWPELTHVIDPQLRSALSQTADGQDLLRHIQGLELPQEQWHDYFQNIQYQHDFSQDIDFEISILQQKGFNPEAEILGRAQQLARSRRSKILPKF